MLDEVRFHTVGIEGAMPKSSKRINEFAKAGAISGLLSGALGGGYWPGIIFVIALVHSLRRNVKQLSLILQLVVMGTSSIAWIIGAIMTLLSYRLELGNGLMAGAVYFALGGGAGALTLWLGTALVCDELRRAEFAISTCLAGAILGAIFGSLEIYMCYTLRLSTQIAHPIVFTIWQVGISIVVARNTLLGDATQTLDAR